MQTKRASGSDRIFYIINYVILTLITLCILYPLLYIVMCSFSSTYAVTTNQVFLWPVGFNVEAYRTILGHSLIRSGYLNAFIYMIGGTMMNLLLQTLCAYPLSRRDLPGNRFFTSYFLFTMFFSGGMIPNYLLLKNLNMLNTRWALIIPFAFLPYYMLVMRTFFSNNIPSELREAASIDGCSEFRFFFCIVLPLSQSVIAVVVLFCAVLHWNGFFRALLYLNDPDLFPLQLVLRDILFISNISEQLVNAPDEREAAVQMREMVKYAVIIVGSLPLMVLYPFVQKYFVKGVMIGSVKA